MLDIAQINAAIGMEILLKSFISKPDDKLGQVNETYKLDDDALEAAHAYLKTAEREFRLTADTQISTIC